MDGFKTMDSIFWTFKVASNPPVCGDLQHEQNRLHEDSALGMPRSMHRPIAAVKRYRQNRPTGTT
jgi:hypothetical protein